MLRNAASTAYVNFDRKINPTVKLTGRDAKSKVYVIDTTHHRQLMHIRHFVTLLTSIGFVPLRAHSLLSGHVNLKKNNFHFGRLCTEIPISFNRLTPNAADFEN